jgi:hypothetical protein
MGKLGKTPRAEHQQTPRKTRESCTSTSEEDWYRHKTGPSPKRRRRRREINRLIQIPWSRFLVEN